MSGYMSPQEVYDEPSRWLSVPHETHDSLGGLMLMIFSDWKGKLTDVHCLECENEEPFVVYERKGMVPKLCTGYLIGDDGQVSLYHLSDVEEGQLEVLLNKESF